MNNLYPLVLVAAVLLIPYFISDWFTELAIRNKLNLRKLGMKITASAAFLLGIGCYILAGKAVGVEQIVYYKLGALSLFVISYLSFNKQ